MEKDKILAKITEIGTSEDDVKRRDLLSELSDDIVNVFDTLDTSNTTIENLNDEIAKNKEAMDKLRESNMSLFLRVEASKSEQEMKKDITGITEPVSQIRKFEDLFDEKGGLK